MQSAALQTAPLSRQQAFRPSLQRRHGGLAARRVAVVRVAAEAELPKGVTVPKVLPTRPPPKFGFVDNAERLNSRAAMIGFFAILVVEGIAHKGILNMVGFTVGQGLPFEF